MNILEIELQNQDQKIALAGIELARSQKALKATNPYNKIAMTEARNAVESASAELGLAYDRLIALRHAVIASKVGA